MAKDRIYLDSCCFIESIKHLFNTGDQDRENDVWFLKQMLQASRDKEIEVVTSHLTIAECRHVGLNKEDVDRTEDVQRTIRSVLCSGKVVTLAQMTLGVAERARDLHWQDGINLGGADAIHVATALQTGCKEFISFDYGKSKSPLKFAAELSKLNLSAITPANTAVLSYHYRQIPLEERKEQ